jgi:signal transduction histidine kinase
MYSLRIILKSLLIVGIFFSLTILAKEPIDPFWKKLYHQERVAYEEVRLENVDSALSMLNSVEKHLVGEVDTTVALRCYLYQGHINFDIGRFQEAISNYLKAGKYTGENPRYCFAINSSLANLFYYIEDYENALKYANNNIQTVRKTSLHDSLLIPSYNLIGLIYTAENNYDSALHYLLKSKTLISIYNLNKLDNLSTFNNIGSVYEYTGQLDSAKHYFSTVITVKRLSGSPDYAWTANHLATTHISLGNPDKANEYIRLTDSLLHLYPLMETEKDLAYTKLLYALTFENLDSVKTKLNYYLDLEDSVAEQKINSNIQEMEAKYQVEKKEAALALSEERRERLAAENETQRIYLIAAIVILLIVGFAFAFAYRTYQQKRKIAMMELEIKDSKLDELMADQESKTYAAMLRGQEKERDRMARELHDRLGGTLAALRLALRKPGNKVEEEDIAILDTAVNEVRSIAHNLSTGLIRKYGLTEAIGQLFKTLHDAGGISFNLYMHPGVAKFGQHTAMELYRIVQELVSNTLKHANATEVSLQSNFEEQTFNLIYEDNGKGFEVEKIKGGIGLENIRERVKKINGNLHIDSKPGRGTIVIVELNRKA